MADTGFSYQSIVTSDGVTLKYIAAGPTSGPVLLFLPGWSQTAIQWKKQISHFRTKYRVLVLDHRGQGESDKPGRGLRISRIAADLQDFIVALKLEDLTLIGHSMGSSIIWAYWDTYADSRSRISKLVFVDQAPVMVADPAWSESYAKSVSAIFKPGSAYEVAAAFTQGEPESGAFARQFVSTMFTPALPSADLDWVMEQNHKMSSKDAAELLLNHAYQDWRDVIPTITVPTLVVGAESSVFTKEGSEWIASQIPGSTLRIFTKEEKGSHFLFWENPEEFNSLLDKFLEK